MSQLSLLGVNPFCADTSIRSRADHLAKAQSLESQGRLKEARECYTKCLDITPEMAYQLIKVN